MWPFSAPLADAAKRDWVDEQFDWARTTYGPAALAARRLIRPTKEFFSAARGEDHGTACAVVDDIRRHLALTHIAITLEPQAVLHEGLHPGYGTLTEVAGTFQQYDDRPVLTYDPRLLRAPIRFIATMAHELIHLKLAPFVAGMPGGEATHELATDLHVIAEGFGTFQLEAAEDAGWAGYLSQPTRAYALARFLRLTGTPPAQAMAHLSARPTRLLKAALAHLDRAPSADS
ncbi:MAG: hypothetical protein ACRC6I_06450 [Paracoccaceae bacterium]